jgi:1,4-alpha-glucan branching enzyme
MGAVAFPGGTTFRVWAPFASTVAVKGEFNEWAQSFLASEGNGYWSTDVPGASPGQEYLFVPNGTLSRRDPYGRIVRNRNSVIYDPNSYQWQNTYGMPGWNQLIIYQIHPGTFPDKHWTIPQDKILDAIVSELGYLKDLGINAIELLPTSEFPGSASAGYNPSDIFAVEDSYGGPNALKRLIDAAHGVGIAVILDVVYNHFGPDDTGTWQFTGDCAHYWIDGEKSNDMGGIYFYQDWRAVTPWGKKNRPDFGRPEVRKYLVDNVMLWLDEFQVDGLRFDAVAYIRNVNGNNDSLGDDLADGWGTLQWMTNEIRRCKGWKISIAEDLKNNAWITKDTGTGGAGFGSQWSPFVYTLRSALTAGRDEERSVSAIRDELYARYNKDAFQRVVYVESHDECDETHGKRRLTDAIAPGAADGWAALKLASLGAVVTLSAPGIPMLFMGEELGEFQPFGTQCHVDWDRQDVVPGMHAVVRDMVRLRADWFNNTQGLRGPHINVFHLNDTEKLIAYHRWDRGGTGDDVIVIANFANRAYDSYSVGLPSNGLWRLRLNTDASCYTRRRVDSSYVPLFGGHPSFDIAARPEPMDGLDFRGTISIGPYTALILSQDR